MITSGALFAGYGGLSLATHDALGTRTLWCSEYEPPSKRIQNPTQSAARIHAHRWPSVPNLGDIQQIDWAHQPEVDVTEGGYPCPGESAAGLRLGMDDPRWMWPGYFALIREMRPKIAIGENVRGHIQRSLRHVVADLQSIGYAASWVTVGACDVFGCHERKRVFWLAYDESAGAPENLPETPFAVLDGGTWMAPDLFVDEPVRKWAYAGAAYAGAAYAGAAPSPRLLRTPTAQLAVNGGSQHPDKRKAGGHGPTLADEVEHLFPTPRAADTTGPGRHGCGGLDLRTAVSLLPTPTASSYGSNQSESDGAAVRPSLDGIAKLLPTPLARDHDAAMTPEARRAHGYWPALRDAPHLLPTPRTGDGTKGGPNQRGSAGDVMLPAAVQPERWGDYAEAILRWELAFGRPAPEATEPGARGGRRLAPAFVEWMMGLPEGWVTDVPGITRNEKLKALGNGVHRQQGAAGIRHLLRSVPAGLLVRLGLEAAA